MPNLGPAPMSMTAGELVEVVKRNARVPVTAITSRHNGSRGVGLYFAGEPAGGLSMLGTIPRRNVFNSDGVVVCRGWADALASWYKDGYLRKTKELVRLMGRATLDYIDRTGSPLIPEGLGLGYHIHLKENMRPEWTPPQAS